MVITVHEWKESLPNNHLLVSLSYETINNGVTVLPANLHPKDLTLSPLHEPLLSLVSVTRANSSDTGITSPATVAVDGKEPPPSTPVVKKEEIAAVEGEEIKTTETLIKFEDARWVNGTWVLKQFEKDWKTDWDDVIVSENPETTSNDEPVIFDTSIIPWWAWMKRYNLPEAELLNGRAAMIGFFMAYFVDSLTGVGLVDQLGNFFCKRAFVRGCGWSSLHPQE
uniref:Uncharacterized protein n=1 Tax=Brassica campestris TaxID=3711 RepID=M4D846_BRACM